MNKKFKFTIASLNNLPKNSATSKSTELEFTDTEVVYPLAPSQLPGRGTNRYTWKVLDYT